MGMNLFSLVPPRQCQVSVYANALLCTTAKTIVVRVPSEIIRGQFVSDNV